MKPISAAVSMQRPRLISTSMEILIMRIWWTTMLGNVVSMERGVRLTDNSPTPLYQWWFNWIAVEIRARIRKYTLCCYVVITRHGPFASPWASCQMRKIAGCACAGNVFPVTAAWQSRHASRHVRDARAMMHARVANQLFPLKSVAGETFPALPAHVQTAILRIC